MMSKHFKAMTLPRLVGNFVLGIARYFTALFTILACLVVFHLFNRTRIHGNAFWRLRPNLMIVSNHQSLIDSYVIGSTLAFPQFLVMPWLLPLHLPEWKNFFASRGLRLAMMLWKAIPLARGSEDRGRNLGTYRRIMDALRHGTVHIFLEGTRSKSEALLPPKPAVAKLILQTRASVLLVGLNGMHRVQPHSSSPDGQRWTILRALGRRTAWIFHFRVRQTVDVIVDDCVITHEELLALAGVGTDEERYQRLASALSDRILQLKESVHPVSSAA